MRAVLLATATACAVAACASDTVTVDLPVAWRSENSRSVIGLMPDGTGTVFELPVWPGVGECGPSAFEAYSGPVTWTSLDDGALRVDAPRGSVLVGADGRFMSFTWNEVNVLVCAEKSQLEDIFVYLRDDEQHRIGDDGSATTATTSS